MASIQLERIEMRRESKSYIDSLFAVLTAAGLYEGPKHRLAGLSGMAFKLSVHERLLPLSVTAYGQWTAEHKPAIDNLGIYTVMDAGRTRHPTFRHFQHDAVHWIKRSLDQGIAAIYWLPEFAVICGYDDEDEVFFVQDGHSQEQQVVMYQNLGLNYTGFWYCQVFGGKVEIPYETMVLESLRLALHDWDTPYKTLPDRSIASGKLAYDQLMRALNSGDYDEAGAVYVMDSYIHARREIAAYLSEALGIWPELDEAAARFVDLASIADGMESCFVTEQGARRIDRSNNLAAQLSDALKLESQAMELLRVLSRSHPDRKRSTLPRWGPHIVR